ncbi:MAG TPA: hypothetical protein VK760_15000, partial [Candidatus Acidoferrales bacterium]|nr:hypothetical protein [Candidatus Acidoferrales bacterium]
MNVAHLGKLTATPIEIALDLEIRGADNRLDIAPSGHAEPRISLVVAFASTPQVKRICGAIGRAVPEKPPAGLRIVPARKRGS